jgi:hypothetical protein
MTGLMVLLPALILGPACTADCAQGFGVDREGNCVPFPGQGDSGRTPTETGSGDTGEPAEALALVWGDPILKTGGTELSGDATWEFVDAVALDQDHALAAGQGGFALVGMSDGRHIWLEEFQRIYDLAWDASLNRAFMASRLDGVYVVDLQDLDQPRQLTKIQEWTGVHEDIAASAGRLLVAAPQTGAVLLDGTTGEVLSTIEAGWVGSVGLHEDSGCRGGQQ